MHQASEVIALFHQLSEILGTDPSRIAGDLPDRQQLRHGKPVENGQPRESIVSDGHCLDLVSAFEVGDQRDDTVLRKMDESNRLIRLPHDFLRLDRHHFGP